ncbi:MAG: NlpC/P60 family protein [Actinomycetota bacterium]|nr:NlpC/P60 family protein [Actinomycetota bacterium]
MRREMSGTRRVRLTALLAALVLGAALARLTAAGASPTPPPNPTDTQLGQAGAAKTALAAQVGALSARVIVIQSHIRELDGAAQVAEQQLALALQRQQQATAAAAAAKVKVAQARAQVDQAQREFVGYVQAAYMSGDVSGTTGSLLTASDPNVLLQQGALQAYQASHQLNAIGNLQRATIGQSNADAAARGALAKQTQATQQAQVAQQNVLTALAVATSQKAALNSQLAAQEQSLQAAEIKLTGLTNQRAAFHAWQVEQARLAAEAAARLRAQQLAQQQAAAANAARQSAKSGGGSSGGGSFDGGGGSSAPIPTGGSWTASKGQQAVNRAMRYLGMSYSWAAGNASGPTYGISEPGSAWNDSNILGYDCSGLTLYAWAPWLSMDHFAATQYTQAGNYHPSTDNLMPGDLLFWSGDGTIGGIGHEAMYIGNGNVIQAPQSGDVIKITNIFNVESGYYGATRPLT